MCILIYDNRKTTQRIDKDIFKRSQDKNPHGMGLMYAHKDKLCVWRAMDDLDGLWDRYIYARNRSLPVALHFRKATAGRGTINADNIHPFQIRPGFEFMHNGTAKAVVPYTPHGTSDTKFINSELFQNFPPGFLQSPIHRVTIENLIDGGRMLFMDNKGRFTILNEKRWGAIWDNGVWYSKGEHLPYYLYGEEPAWVGYGYCSYDLYDYETYDDGVSWWNRQKERKPLVKTTTDTTPFTSTKKETKKERKAKQKAARAKDKSIPAVTGPTPSYHANLIFDYGYLNRVGFYDERLKEVGVAHASDHQLWAMGDSGDEMPAALPVGNSRILGTLYKVTKDYKSVINDIDTMYGCDFTQPDISVYHRRWVKVSLIQNGRSNDVWVWIYRFAMPLTAVSTAAIVPFGDWSRWSSKVPLKLEA